ncbi:MAG: hypothetical protein ACJ72Z_05890 [Pyrinomonadaceae bacterium]
MLLIIGWLIIGIAVAVMFGSFIKGNGVGAPPLWNLAAGVVGGFVGGFAFGMIAPVITGPGPEFLLTLLGAAFGSAVAVFIVKLIKK